MKIDIPYEIGQHLWILTKKLVSVGEEKLYIMKELNYEEYQTKPIWEDRWQLNEVYLKGITYDEDGLMYIFSNNQYLETESDSFESDYFLYEKEVIISTNKSDADEALVDLQNKEE